MPNVHRWLAIASAVTAAMLALALAWRPLTSFDLGYHLAYGAEFWERHRIVEDATFLVPSPTVAESRADLPPGAGFDAAGRYHFPNANWLSQVVMSGVQRAAGAAGLEWLSLALIVTILGAQAVAVHAATGRWTWTGPVVLATALTGYERFYLRPELFGNTCLAGQLALVMRPFTWRRAVAFLALQLVAVNAHSYWLLGVGLAAAMTLEAALARVLPRGAPGVTRTGGAAGMRPAVAVAMRPAVVALLALGLGLVHPSGPRNMALPFETLAYMRAHHIGGSTPEQVRELRQRGAFHPWQDTGELMRTFSPGALQTRTTRAYLALLLLTGPAVVILVRRRRYALACIAAALVLVALPVRRNVATAGFMVWPLVAIAADLAWRRPRAPSRSAWLAAAALALTAVGAAYWTVAVVTNRFYLSEDRETRFGSGYSAAVLPLGVCTWLDAHLDRPQPVFANFNASSSVLYFSRQATGVPILTNAWAYPPARKTRLLEIQAGTESIDPFARDAGLDIAVFYALPALRPLLSRLAAAPDWALVYIEGAYVVFARRSPANEPLVANALRREQLNLRSLLEHARALDPAGGWALRSTAGALAALGWDTEAQSALSAWKASVAAR